MRKLHSPSHWELEFILNRILSFCLKTIVCLVLGGVLFTDVAGSPPSGRWWDMPPALEVGCGHVSRSDMWGTLEPGNHSPHSLFPADSNWWSSQWSVRWLTALKDDDAEQRSLVTCSERCHRQEMTFFVLKH